MKKLNLCAAGIAALFCTYCSDSSSNSTIAGTSEEMNELAENDSSSSDTHEAESSSSIEDQKISSSSGDVHTPPAGGNTLDAYVEQFGLQSKVRFDKAVMAISTGPYLLKQQPIDGSDPYTEFEKEGVAKFTQENIGEIEEYFPNAAETYAETVSAVKNGSNECTLYSYNSYGNEKYVGLVLEYISPDTLKVTGIAAKNCEETTGNMFVRFLVSYCGDLNKEPVIIENTVESSIKKEQCPAVNETEWVSVIDPKDIVTSSSSETPNSSSSKEIETCAPGSDCDGDGIPDGIYRPDLEPCDTDTLLYFFGRSYQCIENKWVYLPPPGPDSTYSQARNVSVLPRQGMAVAPRVVMARNEDGTISIRDDGYNASNNFVIEAVYTELSGDTIIVDVIYPDGANVSSYQISALTFTVSKVYTNVKYIKYKDSDKVQEIYEVDELLPCASSTTCRECGEGLTC